ncbi:MAG: hypothetical protein LRY40_09455 [Shewanella fodinae]|nr:hypothetical protein [Shewanella fodinae]
MDKPARPDTDAAPISQPDATLTEKTSDQLSLALNEVTNIEPLPASKPENAVSVLESKTPDKPAAKKNQT